MPTTQLPSQTWKNKPTKYENLTDLLMEFVSEFEERNDVVISTITYQSKKTKDGTTQVNISIKYE